MKIFVAALVLFLAAIGNSEQLNHDPSKSSGIYTPTNQMVPKLKCDSGEGLSVKKEINDLTLKYISHLESDKKIQNSNKAAIRESIKFRLAQLLNSHDPQSCFVGIAEVSTLCPLLQSDVPITQQDSTQTILAQGFTMQRKAIAAKDGAYSKSWRIIAPNGDAAGLATDKDGDGFVDYIVLGGKFKQAMSTTNNDRDIGAGINWRIKEREVGFEDDIIIDLKTEPYLSSFSSLDTVERCLGVAGNPATLIALAGKEKNWNPSDAVLTTGKHMMAATLGGWEGLQRGRRGLVVGVKNAAISTGEGIKGLFWDLPKGA